MYVIFTTQDGITYFWLGAGNFTFNIKEAKHYTTWEAAQAACNRIKRWDMKYASEEDFQD